MGRKWRAGARLQVNLNAVSLTLDFIIKLDEFQSTKLSMVS